METKTETESHHTFFISGLTSLHSNGSAPMTNTVLIFINCFDNANFDAVVKGLPKLPAKASELRKVAR